MPNFLSKSSMTRALGVLALAGMISGCATGPRVTTHSLPDADFDAYQTFGWPEEVGTDRGGYETHITQYFKQAARREMEELGYRYVDEDPDLLVNFYANAEKHEDVYARPSLSSSMGYYDYRFGMYNPWPVYTMEVDSYEYTTGTANIDVVDARRRLLLWEGRAEGRLTSRIVTDPRAAVDDVVEEIFEKFPTR